MESIINDLSITALIYQTALRLLARREHTQFELTRKLQQRGYSIALIQPQLEKLRQENYLSEARFTESYIRSRAQRGYGPLRIKAELQHRGVSADLLQQFFSTMAIDWALLAEQARRKRFGKNPPRDLSERARQARFLQYRGFSHDHCARQLED